MIDLSPKLRIPSADIETLIDPLKPQMGQNVGGFYAFSNVFKRGYGDKVFGSDSNGIWLGKADFEGAPFNVDMDGNAELHSATFVDENGTTIIDATGLVSTASFSNNNTARGTSQSFTTTSYVDLTSSSMTFTLARTAGILFLVNANLNIIESAGNTGDGVMFIDIDGAIDNGRALFCKSGHPSQQSYGLPYYTSLGPGSHTVKLKARLEAITAGAPVFKVNEYRFSYVILGT